METYVLTGRLAKDCEIVNTKTGKQVIVFQVPVDQSYNTKDGKRVQKTKWVRCQWWTTSEKVHEILKKGNIISVTGEPFASAFTNKNGEVAANLEVKVFSVYREHVAPENKITKQENQQITEHESYNPELLAEQADDLPY